MIADLVQNLRFIPLLKNQKELPLLSIEKNTKNRHNSYFVIPADREKPHS